ncbi:MAG: DNA polymerase III subunit delta [Prevotella sp.]|nr:DNA polymerase III subunit delta [Prevotella sp.]
MAEAKPTTYAGIMSSLKAGHYAPVYYLMGDEGYYIDKISDYIAANALPEEQRDFNQTIFFGSDVTAAQVADTARRYPMMAERQVVIVKEAQNIKQTEALERYMQKPNPQTVLVICHKNGKIDGRKLNYVKAVKQAAIIFESKKLGDRELPHFIQDYMQQHSVSIDAKSVQMIADATGADLARLTTEMDKLMTSLTKDDRRVTPAMVEQQVGVSKDFNAFELKDAIIRRDVFKANQIISYFEKNPKAGSVYSLMPLLFGYFQNLLAAYYAPNNKSQESVAAHLGLRSPYAARDYMTGMQNYRGPKVLQIIHKMREVDAKSKGLDNPSTPAEQLMQELVYFILH